MIPVGEKAVFESFGYALSFLRHSKFHKFGPSRLVFLRIWHFRMNQNHEKSLVEIVVILAIASSSSI